VHHCYDERAVERHRLSILLRLVGLAIPAGAVLLLSSAFDRPSDGPRGGANLLLFVVLLMAAFAGAALFRSCSSVLVIPFVIIITAQLHQETTCPECHDWTYDRGLGGAILGTVVFLVPLAMAALMGTAVGMSWSGNRRRTVR
jgi:uncharacterized membrane protein